MNIPPQVPTLFDELLSTRSDASTETVDSPIPEEIESPESSRTFYGAAFEPIDDSALLPIEARQALLMLLRHGVIMADQRPEVYAALMRYQTQIRSLLANMYLRFLVDEKVGMIILLEIATEENNEEDEDRTSVLRTANLRRYETIVVLVLRKYFLEQETAGERRIVIDKEKLNSLISPFLPESNNSALDDKKLNGAIKTLKQHLILRNVPRDDDRFEIHPIIRYLINADFLNHMLSEYQAIAMSEQDSTAEEDE